MTREVYVAAYCDACKRVVVVLWRGPTPARGTFVALECGHRAVVLEHVRR